MQELNKLELFYAFVFEEPYKDKILEHYNENIKTIDVHNTLGVLLSKLQGGPLTNESFNLIKKDLLFLYKLYKSGYKNLNPDEFFLNDENSEKPDE